MATSADYRLGDFAYPRGWFMIGTADEAVHAPKAIRYFGEDLVVYRGASGAPYVVEAYCPHMGAHLARNTTSYIVRDDEQVEGESIRCPYHGWRFGADGRCDDIPYSDARPKAAKLRTFPTIERAGILWVWYDPEGLDPEFPLPEFGGYWDTPGWVRWKIDHMGDLASHPIEVVDNMADLAHFAPIHGSIDATYFANEFKDHVAYQYFSSGHRTLVSTPGAQLTTETWYTGPAILQSEMKGDFDSFIMIAHTPVEEGCTRVWHGLMVRVNDGSAPVSGDLLDAAAAYQEGSRAALAQDVEVWHNKRPCINPMVVPGDGPFGKLRIWYKQFFQPRGKAGEYRTRANGLVVSVDKRPQSKVA